MVQGECKWAVAGYRKKRTGHHPRDPAKPATEEPTAGLPGTNKGVELGADVEAEALKEAEEAPKHDAVRYEETQEASSGSAGSSTTPPAPQQ